MRLYDLEQERVVLAGVLAHQDYFMAEIEPFINEGDFYSKESITYKTIFLRMKALLDEGKKLDIALLSHHIKSANLTFKDVDSVGFLDGLGILSEHLDEAGFKNAVDVIKLLTLRRKMSDAGGQISKEMETLDSSASFDEILEKCDEAYNSKIELFENSSGNATNLFSIIGDLVNERAQDRSIFKDDGVMGPHKSVNRLCGSLTKPGNITIVCAGSGVGKTQFTTHYCMSIAGREKIPILHLDNGEMTEEEIAFRMCASGSGVPLHLIESGEWFDSSNSRMRVESTIKKMDNNEIRYDYYNVGGKNIDEILTYIRRYYHNKIKRGNPLIINFDYIKSSFELTSKFKSEFQIIGELVDKFKKLIQRDIVFNGRPMISLVTSIQSNRIGTVGNRRSENVVDDESVISLSHRVKQFCSHMLILRHKTMDELQNDPVYCGRHLMKIEKARSYGADFARAENLVEMPDGTHQRNHINFEFDNFKIIDRGDLVDLVGEGESINELEGSSGEDDLPI
ncbi:MAG: replicative DNA helicase [Bacteriovoracaceae bacterium]|jgi:replicative DNA helicase